MTYQNGTKGPVPSVVWLIAGISTILMSGFGMVIPLLPVYGRELGAGPLELGLLVAAFFLGRVFTQMPAGHATDRFGRRPVLLGALIGYTVTCLGYAQAQTAYVLIAFRLMQGISSGFFSVAARALINDICDENGRGIGQGIYASSVNMGFVAGPVIGSMTAARYGIVSPFVVATVLSAISFLVMLLTPMRVAPIRQAQSAAGPSYQRLARPWCFRRFQLLALINMAFVAGLSVIMTLFPIVGDTEISGGLAFVGIALTVSGLFGFLFSPLIGLLSDRYGRLPFLFIGVVLAASEGGALLFSRHPILIGACFAGGGIGVACFSNGLHALVGDLTVERFRGVATGFIGLFGEIGGILGALMASWVWSQADLRLPFAVQPVLSVFALFMLLLFWKRKTPRPAQHATMRENILPG